MSKTVIAVTLVVVVVSTAIIGWSFFGLGPSLPPAPETITQTVPPPQATESSTPLSDNDLLPIGVPNRYVRSAVLRYYLVTTVQDIKNVPEGLELVITFKAREQPKVIVTNQTQIFFNRNGENTPASVSDLKPKQSIGMNISYDLIKKTWETVKIHIFMKTASASTPSAVPVKP